MEELKFYESELEEVQTAIKGASECFKENYIEYLCEEGMTQQEAEEYYDKNYEDEFEEEFEASISNLREAEEHHQKILDKKKKIINIIDSLNIDGTVKHSDQSISTYFEIDSDELLANKEKLINLGVDKEDIHNTIKQEDYLILRYSDHAETASMKSSVALTIYI